MKSLEYKAPGGKLLKLDINLTGNKISYIQITGDFFIHPEEAIIEIEKILTNARISSVRDILKDYVKNNSILFIGVNVNDLIQLINKAKNN